MAMGGLGNGGVGRRRPRAMNEINVTPLVDVMLVLLVIFIVTAPALKDAIDVDLPRARGDGKTQGAKAPLMTVAVDKEGRVHVSGQTLQPAEVAAKLPGLLKGHENEMMTLKASRQLPFEVVVKVMSVMRGSGIKGINVAVDAISTGN